MRTPRIFISMGTPYHERYTQFRSELLSLLRDRCGVDPRMIGVNEYPSGAPVHKIRDVMSSCDGVIIVAYERTFVSNGLERRGGSKERLLNNERFTTPWNHIESAMAFSLRLPLYIICEQGVTEEGLIESKVDWFVQRIDFTSHALSSTPVIDSIRSWIEDRVEPHSRKSKSILSAAAKLRLSEMTGEEWTAIIAMLTAAFTAGVGAATFFPKLFN